MNVSSDFIEGLKKDAYKWYFEKYESHSTVADKICELGKSDARYEKETVATGPGQLDEVEETEPFEEIALAEARNVIVANKKYGNLLPITLETEEDFQKAASLIKTWASNWGEAAIRTQEIRVANLFNKGGYTAGDDATFDNTVTGVIDDPSGDGVYDGTAASPLPFFNLSNNTRQDRVANTYYNGLALNLTEANLITLYTLMCSTNAKNESGEKVAIYPDTLLVPNNKMKFTAQKIIESDKVVGSNHNDKNVLKNIVNVVAWPYLTDADAYFLGVAGKGIKFYSRKMPEITFFENQKKDVLYAKIRMRFGAAVTNWRYWAGSNFATS